VTGSGGERGRRVFCVGFPGTGLGTLGACLKTLGHRHRMGGLKELRAALRGDWPSVFSVTERLDSFADWPWPLLFLELDARYPGSRFILTTRKDSGTWIESLLMHADLTGATAQRKLVYGFEPRGNEAEATALYEAHNRAVRTHFAQRPDDLLELCWDCGDGWRELCAFLGRPLPDALLPHLNSSVEKQAWRRTLEAATDRLRTVTVMLGPYRNLTTITASTLSLHPRCVVLNHSHRDVKRSGANFLRGRADVRFRRFCHGALEVSKARAGGAINRSHAFTTSEFLRRRFSEVRERRAPDEPVDALVWKESHKATNDLRRGPYELGELLDRLPALRFLQPIRNPLDCALSYAGRPGRLRLLGLPRGVDPSRVLEMILEHHAWFLEQEKRFPERLLHFVEDEVGEDLARRLQAFLELEPEGEWIRDFVEAFQVRPGGYFYSAEILDTYHELLDRLFQPWSELRERLRALADTSCRSAGGPAPHARPAPAPLHPTPEAAELPAAGE